MLNGEEGIELIFNSPEKSDRNLLYAEIVVTAGALKGRAKIHGTFGTAECIG